MVNQLGNHGGLLRPERRGRLVHDEDFGVEQDGAGDGDRLALTAREVLHRVLDVLEVRVEAMQHRARLVLHGIVVEQLARRPQLAAAKEFGRLAVLVCPGVQLADGLESSTVSAYGSAWCRARGCEIEVS